MPKMTLRHAVELYSAEERAAVNAYDWYRKWAHHSGRVPLGNVDVRARMQGRTWVVRSEDVKAAIEGHRVGVALVMKVTDDYGRGILQGEDGETIRTDWGGYRRNGAFHFARSDYEIARRRSDGTWMCSTCMKAASSEHGREECHRCADWGSCGRDCTLSRVYCSSCGTSSEP